MRYGLKRLAGATLLLVLSASAESTAFLPGSAVIVRPERLISVDRIDVADPDNANSRITEWAYDVEFAVTSQLAGPDLGEKARIMLIDQRKWSEGRLFMIVHRDGRGRLWARRAWQEVSNELCLSAQQVETLGLAASFSHARDNDEGLRCISV